MAFHQEFRTLLDLSMSLILALLATFDDPALLRAVARDALGRTRNSLG